VLRAFLSRYRRKPEMAYEAARAFPSLGLHVPQEAAELIERAVAMVRGVVTGQIGV
jgi:hypothetical protein